MASIKILQTYLSEPGADKADLVAKLAALGVVQCSADFSYPEQQRDKLRELFELPSTDNAILTGDIISGGSF